MRAAKKKRASSRRAMTVSRKAHLEEILDEGLQETFPASDAVAIVEPVTHEVDTKPKKKSP